MRTIETEIAVVGAGPAGLSAAIRAANAGAKVLVIDENHVPGGQLFKQIHKFFGSGEHRAGIRGFRIGEELLEKLQASGNAEVCLDSVAYGFFGNDFTLGLARDGKTYAVKAQKYILAAGAMENCLAFPGSTLPGVMGAGAAQTMMNINRVRPGNRVLMIGSGNVGLIVSYQLMQAGADVVELIEAAPRITGFGVHAGKIRRAGVPVSVGTTIKRALGETEVTGAELVNVDEHFKPIPGTERTVSCDTICLAVGLSPMTELAWMAGCRFAYIRPFGHVPVHNEDMESTVPGVYLAGDITGSEEASTAMEEGNLAGISAAAALGRISADEADAAKQEIRHRLDALRSGAFGEMRMRAKKEQISAYYTIMQEGERKA